MLFDAGIGVRNRFLLLILPVVALGLSACALHASALRGEGNFEFYLDISSLPTGGHGTIQLFQIAVPTKELRYSAKGERYLAQLRFTISLSSKTAIVYQRRFQLNDTRDAPPTVKDLSAFLFAVDSCVVDPGTYRLDVKVEDLQHRKRSLLGILRRTYFYSEVREPGIEVPEYPAGSLALGEPILVWAIEANKGYIPNPMQVYGLKKDTLTVLANAIVPESLGADSVTVRISLSKGTGDAMQQTLFRAPVRGGRCVFTRSFDLTTFPAGDYRATVEMQAGTGAYATAGKDFNVAWDLVNWQKPMRDILVEARILLRDKEFDAFQKMSLGEQESFMRSFWKKLDPTPATAVNETYEKFIARVRYADAHFGLFERGALSDRGYIYIKLGAPDEIIHKPVPKDRGDLEEGLEKVQDAYKIVVDGFTTSHGPARDLRPPLYSSDARRAYRGMGGGDAGSFELWNYNFKGDPILPEDKGMTIRQGMRFLFVDKDGFGDYRLAGTSEEASQ